MTESGVYGFIKLHRFVLTNISGLDMKGDWGIGQAGQVEWHYTSRLFL
jgi:hypothetical protein